MPRTRQPLPAWGRVGSTARAGETVIRSVDPNVGYAPPPLGRVWRPSEEPGRFVMDWPGDPSGAAHLGQITDRERLDAAVFALLGAAGRLHDAGWRLGLIAPENVIVDADNGVTLIDLGFTSSGEGGEPAWLADDTAANPPRAIWEEEPARRQSAAPGAAAPVSVASDLACLARLIAWVLTGRPAASVSPLAGDVWAVLVDAEGGRFVSAAEFAEVLREAPPSSHYAAPPVAEELVRRPGVGRWLRRAGVAAALLAVAAAGVGLWRAWPEAKRKTPATKRKRTPTQTIFGGVPARRPIARGGMVRRGLGAFAVQPAEETRRAAPAAAAQATDGLIGLIHRADDLDYRIERAAAGRAAVSRFDADRAAFLDAWVEQFRALEKKTPDAARPLYGTLAEQLARFAGRLAGDPKLQERERRWLQRAVAAAGA